eukprot:comp12106_c0_seq1/m.6841 comp12106_c0_seq1/g.6841  ORF comp12106_c0_seq1/g.6841 comp12106_c0_seq1/m.6841 type:complete len:972 (-) comp12106_c0_seq1:73-2988(-)
MFTITALVNQISRFYRAASSANATLHHAHSVGHGQHHPHPEPDRLVRLGVCAMDKKTKAKPMMAVLDRIRSFGDIEVIIFGDDCILNKPIEEWPEVDALISFFSTGFPLEKALAYVELRKPYLINDLETQRWLLDRKKMYEVLMENDIPVPRHAFLERDGDRTYPSLIEEDDAVVIGGQRFVKPFVEKPFDAEDHNIRIYYPRSAGGGAQQLFRKIGDKSSEFLPDCNTIRRDGSYIYEEFLATEGTDVKVYGVGPYYAHAEARKSPVVDGKVQRSADGKEIRYPVMLSADEKLIAQQVCKAFRQLCCGFDLLRTNGESFVCDVNGWSFVKGNLKYYEDAALILRENVLQEIAPERLKTPIIELTEVPMEVVEHTDEMAVDHLELRCVIGVFRHGDRTPKQKMKMVVTHDKFLSFFKGQDQYKELKIKKPQDLQRLLNITRELLSIGGGCESDIEERLDKLMQMKYVLERGGHFSGINRKVQLKPIRWVRDRRPSACEPDPQEELDESGQPKGISKKGGRVAEAVLILKWGGELTQLGRQQGISLGEEYRSTMYPGESRGLLRLHSTFRHDLKIYCSDEGRVQVTAAAFTKGFLQLDGNLTPILVSLCRKDSNLLDDSSAASKDLAEVKTKVHSIMTTKEELKGDILEAGVPTGSVSLRQSLEKIGSPLPTLRKIYQLIQSLTAQLLAKRGQPEYREMLLYSGETITLVLKRWEKLEKDFYNKKKDKFDISKIPDIYDCIKYDCLHNYMMNLDGMDELYYLVKAFADYVVPQEYGTTAVEKATIGRKIGHELVKKVLLDLAIASESNEKSHQVLGRLETVHRLDTRYARNVGVRSHTRHVRTRLYFTSESHIHSMLNVLRYGIDGGKGLVSDQAMGSIEEIPEINYLSQIIFMLYENYEKDIKDPERYMVKMLFSPGVAEVDPKAACEDPKYGMAFTPLIPLNDDMILDDVESFFNRVLEQYNIDEQEAAQ